MRREERARKVLAYFLREMPEVDTELTWHNPFGLLVAVILSAQCTDKRVNQITPPLLQAYPTPSTMAQAGEDAVFEYVKSCSYPRSKARYLVSMAQRVTECYKGEVPQDYEGLTSLAGVGRKTANVMLSVAFGKPALAVDTHVHRVAKRLGLTRGAKNVESTEQQLTTLFAKEYWSRLHHWLILHGRYVCKARAPQCEECGLRAMCAYTAHRAK